MLRLMTGIPLQYACEGAKLAVQYCHAELNGCAVRWRAERDRWGQTHTLQFVFNYLVDHIPFGFIRYGPCRFFMDDRE